MRVAIDVGYGAVKAMTAAHRVQFPAVLARADGDTTLATALGGSQPDPVYVAAPGTPGATWWVGRDAHGAPDAVRPWGVEATEREGYDVLVWAALHRLAPPGPAPVSWDLALGLPLGLFATQRDALRARFQGITANVGDSAGTARPMHIQRVWVWPQAAGAYYGTAVSAEGQILRADLLECPVGIIDVGYRTTDYFVMMPGDGGPRPVKALAGSLDTGAVLVMDGIRRRVETATGQLLDPLQIERVVEAHRPLTVLGHDVPYGDWLDEEATRVAVRVRETVRSAWGREWATLGAVILAGGGAVLLGDPLRAVHPTAELAPDPVFSNAAGFLAATALLAAA